MAAAACPHHRTHRPPSEKQIADQIKRLMAGTLIRPPQRVSFEPRVAKHKQIGPGDVPAETCSIEPLGLFGCHKGAGSGQLFAKRLRRDIEHDPLGADRRMLVLKRVVDREAIVRGRGCLDPGVSLLHPNCFANDDRPQRSPKALNPTGIKRLDIRHRRAIQTWQLASIDVDLAAVDAQAR